MGLIDSVNKVERALLTAKQEKAQERAEKKRDKAIKDRDKLDITISNTRTFEGNETVGRLCTS
jgi:hypothetical protein